MRFAPYAEQNPEGGGNTNGIIEIHVKQEKTCAICGKKFYTLVEHSIPLGDKDRTPKLVEKMAEVAQKEPCFQVCDGCRDRIQNPQFTITG